MKQTFEQWIEALKTEATKIGYRITDDESWRHYFEHGYTPIMALQEDLSYL